MTLGSGELCRRGVNAVVITATEVRFTLRSSLYVFRMAERLLFEGGMRSMPALLIRTICINETLCLAGKLGTGRRYTIEGLTYHPTSHTSPQHT